MKKHINFPVDKYRIVADEWAGYEIQKKRWWYPFWRQIGYGGLCTNTFSTYDIALEVLKKHKEGIKLYYEDK